VEGSSRRQARIGLIVNPIAGLGGRVALKGSDGAEIVERALALGAVPEAGARARRSLVAFAAALSDADRLDRRVLTAPAEMGETAAREVGCSPLVVGEIAPGRKTASDTRRIAVLMREIGVDLLLFAGGDGTARDVHDAVGTTMPVLGIPAGVKVYSAAFARGPEAAGGLAAAFLAGRASERDAEVLDLDEAAYRAGRVSPSLHGFLRVPYRRDAMRGGKAPASVSDRAAADEIAEEVVSRMSRDAAYVLGPGTTTSAVARRLGLPKTLVGVDVVTLDEVVAADATERRLLEVASERPLSIVVTPIGGQGFLFGRGNPQIGPAVLRLVPRERIIVIAGASKLAALGGRPLLVDTGDREVDAGLAGYVRVVTGRGEATVYRVAS
jgi:predicted polyphosphate/ATP-dependent NAD kinase